MGDPDMDAAITAALHRGAAERGCTPGLTVTEYIVVAAAAGWDDAGNEVCQVVLLPSGPGHRIAGLLREATVRMDAEMLAPYIDD